MDLKRLQEEVNARWQKQEENPCHGSDPSHALLHMTKALGKIASAVNDAEHEHRALQKDEVAKYLADLVLCAARFGCDIVDLDEACAERLAQKFSASPRPWGVFDVEQKRWWPRFFTRESEAQAHYYRCKGPGSRGEVRPAPEEAMRPF